MPVAGLGLGPTAQPAQPPADPPPTAGDFATEPAPIVAAPAAEAAGEAGGGRPASDPSLGWLQNAAFSAHAAAVQMAQPVADRVAEHGQAVAGMAATRITEHGRATVDHIQTHGPKLAEAAVSHVTEHSKKVAGALHESGSEYVGAAAAGISRATQGAGGVVVTEVGGARDAVASAASAGGQAVLHQGVKGAVKIAVGAGGVIDGVKETVAGGAILTGAAAAAEAASRAVDALPEHHRERFKEGAEQFKHQAYNGAVAAAQFGGEMMVHYQNSAAAGREIMRNAAQEAWEELPEADRQRWLEETDKARARGQGMKLHFLELSRPFRQQVFDKINVFIQKKATADKDMQACVRYRIRSAINDIWRDVVVELDTEIEKLVLPATDDGWKDYQLSSCSPLWIRAWVLYHFLPYDKSIFGQLRDPWWWILMIPSVIPLFCARVVFFAVILFFVLFPHHPDEFQLISLILRFKGTQFISGGVVACFIGAAQYFVAVNYQDTPVAGTLVSQHTANTQTSGPGSIDGAILESADFLGSCLLVWVAFAALPYSKKRGFDPKVGAKDEETEVGWCGLQRVRTRGGRLRTLLRYDVWCFFTTVMLCGALCGLNKSAGSWDGMEMGEMLADYRFRANVFWCRVVYSFLTMPFVIFCLPVITKILTHAEPTGFTRLGTCVRKQIEYSDEELAPPPPPKAAEPVGPADAELDAGKNV